MKITLITCTYNADRVLQRTLDSILRQTYTDIEHLIIDGKSKDDTVSIAQQYKAANDLLARGHRVTIKSEPDEGLYDAMNKGIAMATGDFLCFMNAGDILAEADTIEKIVKAMEKNGRTTGQVSVIYGETDVVNERGEFQRHRRLRAPKHLTWRSFRQGMLVCHQAFYANTAIAKDTPFDMRYKISGDVDWCIRIMKNGEQQGMDTLNTDMVLCRYLAGGMSVQNHRASLQERWDTMVRHYGLFTTVTMHIWFTIRAVVKK